VTGGHLAPLRHELLHQGLGLGLEPVEEGIAADPSPELVDDDPYLALVTGGVRGAQQVAPQALVLGGQAQPGAGGADRAPDVALVQAQDDEPVRHVDDAGGRLVLQVVGHQPAVGAARAPGQHRAPYEVERVGHVGGLGRGLGRRPPQQPAEHRPVDPYLRAQLDPAPVVVVQVGTAARVAPEPVGHARHAGVADPGGDAARPDRPAQHGRVHAAGMRREVDQDLRAQRTAALVHRSRRVDLDRPEQPDVDRRPLAARTS
jgi:hypothetical protein